MMTWMSYLFMLLMVLGSGSLILIGVWIGYKAGKGEDVVRGFPSDLEPMRMREDARVAFGDDDEDE
jgi:hypothetical protein